MRTKFFFLITLLSLTTTFYSQEKEDKKLEIYGFVRADLFGDSHIGLNAANEQFYLLPLYAGVDTEGNGINNQFSSNLATMATRLGLRFYGPEVFGAKTLANIEGDFAGDPATFTAVVRLRQANVKFNWAKSQLLVGQDWHPLWTGSIFPTVGSLNTGAPYQPFNRSPQLRFNYTLQNITLSGAAVYEFQFASTGPSGKTDRYQRNSGLPEMFASAEFNKGMVTLGAGVSYKHIKPMLFSSNGSNQQFNSNTLLSSTILMGYGQFKTKQLVVKAKTILGQNTGFLLMPGGFGVKSIDGVTGDYDYANYNNSYSFINAVLGKTWQLGIFGGYMLNLGTSDPLLNTGSPEKPEAKTWGMLPSIQRMYRFAPHIAHNVQNVRIVLEYEHTLADYGVGDIQPIDGLYNSSVKAINNRILLMFMYFF